MIIYFILFSLFAVAGIAKAVSDKITFHFEQSIFANRESFFWEQEISWRNKWKNGNKSEGEAFPFSSTFFVWVTDAWHLFNAIRGVCYFIAVGLCLTFTIPIIPAAIVAVIGWAIRTSFFHVCFTYLFEKSETNDT